MNAYNLQNIKQEIMINNFFLLFMCAILNYSSSQGHRKDECEKRCNGLALCIAPIYDETSKFCALIFRYESTEQHEHRTPKTNELPESPLSNWFENQKTEVFMTDTNTDCERSCHSERNCATYLFDHDTSTCKLFYGNNEDDEEDRKW